MKLSVSAYRAHASAHKKILSSGYHTQLNYGSTGAASSSGGLYAMETNAPFPKEINIIESNNEADVISPAGSNSGQEAKGALRKHRSHRTNDEHKSSGHFSDSKSISHRKSRIGDEASDPDSDWTRSNQRWMKLRTTVQISSAMQKKPPLKREDSFLKRFSTRQIPETQETVEDTGSESASGDVEKTVKRRRRYLQKRRSVVNPDENFYFYWLMMLTICVLYNMWALIVRQSFPELQKAVPNLWFICDSFTDVVFIFDVLIQLRTGYLEQGLMVYDDRKLAYHYIHSGDFFFDIGTLIPLDLLQLKMGTQPLLRFTRFFKVYRCVKFYYIVESRTVWPNLWRVVNLIHILLILAHWFGCFYYLLSEAEGFQGDWVYPYRPGDYATLTRKYLGSLYWSTLTLTTIGDLPTPETNAEYIFTIVSYLIGVFIFATIVGQVGNVITNRNANRLEFERLLDGAKTYMRHHKVPGGMKRRVLRWYDYSWSRGRIQGGGDINTALGLLPDKLKTELALHVNLSVLKKVTIFQECQPEFLHDLVLKMKAYIFTPGDSICRKGEVAREMFIIADGILEVLSETGKVLTTMKAGDFFGEIGILNLDGLNKRTADVRSVGYSELFSLSREDVLAAMKDYPDAQEILQTLGRKRLMEVRCVNKKYAKPQIEKEPPLYPGHIHQSDSSENSASKKIVEKLRNDVKGLRNVLKKSRATSRRSDESLEMQPLHNISPKNGKSMLKRMSRVRSDDKDVLDDREEPHDQSPSPIGAGLPLLQRLRLLKEKQEREERAVRSTPPMKSPPNSHITCTLSPQESIQEDPEREICEGLPLIQRLQYIQEKNDVLSNEINRVAISAATGTKKLDTISFVNNNSTSRESISPSLSVAQIKPNKVSFKKILQQLPNTEAARCLKNIHPYSGNTAKPEPPKSLRVTKLNIEEVVSKTLNTIPTRSKKIVNPSIMASSDISEANTPIKPWSKLKLATLLSSSYTSLSNCSPDEVEGPLKNYSLENIPHMMIEESASAPTRTQGILSRSRGSAKSRRSSNNCNKTKFYQSVFDLSPEYSGLPFVKRLKILNERQKLVELEKVLQTRSFSLDSSKTNNEVPLSESLYRCYSDTSSIYAQFMSTYKSSSTTSSNTSTSDTSKTPAEQLETAAHDYSPLSPDLNETLERLKLKSILKKLHKCKNHDDQKQPPKHSKGLLREPTLEGSVKTCTNEVSFGVLSTSDKKTHLSDPVSTHSKYNCVTANFESFMTDGAASNLQNNNVPMSSKGAAQTNKNYSSLYEVQKVEGIPESHEYVNQILYVINDVIRTHMNEMRFKFESEFSTMAGEVKKRDEIIGQLEMKLKNLELKSLSSQRKSNRDKVNKFSDDMIQEPDDNNSSGSSAELLFMRGDSLDTVFTSSPPIQNEYYVTSPSTSKHLHNFSASYPYQSYPIFKSHGNRRKSNSSGENRTVSSNLTRISDSVILDIGESSSSSSSSSKLNKAEGTEKESVETEPVENIYHNDWEVKMLAAEMEKQERKRGHSLSENVSDIRQCGTFLRRHRQFSDTETDYSETDAEEMAPSARPRASSLDQFNLTYGVGRDGLKTLSIDRDKDKL